MGLLPLNASELGYLKQLIREVIAEVAAEKSASARKYQGSPPDPVMLSFVELYFSPTMAPEVLGYDSPYDLYCSFPKAPKLTKPEFTRRFCKACTMSHKLGVVERARTSQMKGLRWIRFATSAEIKERKAK